MRWILIAAALAGGCGGAGKGDRDGDIDTSSPAESGDDSPAGDTDDTQSDTPSTPTETDAPADTPSDTPADTPSDTPSDTPADTPSDTPPAPTCVVDADCGPQTDCSTPTCDGGSCTTRFAAAGSLTPSGDGDGDCLASACDGNGGVSRIFDPTDPPFVDACTLTSCRVGGGVDTSPLFVPDDGNACTLETCDPGQGPSYAGVAYGTTTPDQTVGDCKRQICDGNGGTANVPDNADLPVTDACAVPLCGGGNPQQIPLNVDDGNVCTLDTCDPVLGPQYTAVSNGTPCPGGVCFGGACAIP
jgi:hypothetical protein